MPIQTAVHHLKRRRTKIVATLGPASSEPAMVERLIRTGVDVFRLNFSHGDAVTHREVHARVRETADRLGLPVAVLADLCGPKIRVGRFRGGSVTLGTGSMVTVTTRDVMGEDGLIPSLYGDLHRDVRVGDRILLDDGTLELNVAGVEGTEVRAEVVHGGVLRDRKGMNLPGVPVSAPSLTPKDREDARLALELGVDFLALSFVRTAADVEELRELVDGAERPPAIIAKIEKPEALDGIERILGVADGIMVARGDLGVELPPEAVPLAQSQLIDLAREHGRPVIVATQMLESMVEHPRPTRAEVSDVANAVRAGADALMLSAETAAGAHPVEAVTIMDRVARETEGYLWEKGAFGHIVGGEEEDRPLRVQDAVARATAQLSRDLMVRAVVVLSVTGRSAAMVSAARPQAPVLAPTTDPGTSRRMSLLWGVVPVLVEEGGLADPAPLIRDLVRRFELAQEGQYVLRVGGFHWDLDRETPTVTVLRA